MLFKYILKKIPPSAVALGPGSLATDEHFWGTISWRSVFSDCQIRRSSRRQAPTTCPALITISDETRRALAEHSRLYEI